MEQQRVILAIALSLLVLFVWQSYFGPKPEDMANMPSTTNGTSATGPGQGTSATTTGTSATTTGQTDTKTVPPAPVVPTEKIDPEVVPFNSDEYEAAFTNVGARLETFTVLKPEQYQPRGNTLSPVDDEGELKHLPFALAMSQPATLAEQAMYKVTSKDGPSIVMRYTDPARRFTLEKRYTHDPELRGSFKVDITLTNTQKEAPLTDSLSVVMYGKMPASSGEWSLFNPIPDITEAVCFVDGGVERAGSDDAKENPKHTGAVVWGGVDSRYFTTTILSNKDTPFASCSFSLVDSEYLRTELGLGSFNLAPGQQQTWNLRSYVGPKSTEQMAAFGVDLERSIDYGIFEFLCRPIRWTLVLFYGWTGNWGIAIILLTIFLRTLLFPINHKSFKSMEGLRRIQEPMQEIREKYEHDQMKMQEEMMKLYKKENVSPFGCLPQLLQIPIFFAFYRTIYSSVELYHANFFGWYTDLSAPDPYFILPVLVGLAMVGQQFLMPQTAQNEQMKYMMYAMPVMFSVFTFVLPSGLALYIFVSVLLGILQQYYIRRTSDSQAEAKKA